METNGEAADFIIHRHEFVGKTAELTSDGKDHILELAARMRSTPFPVLIERGENNGRNNNGNFGGGSNGGFGGGF
jgi:hypothetical protein